MKLLAYIKVLQIIVRNYIHLTLVLVKFVKVIELIENNNHFFLVQSKVRATIAEKGEYYSSRPPTPLLDTINHPMHMKNLSIKV